MQIPITSANCLQETGFDFLELLSLSGVFGIHPKADFNDLLDQGKIKYRGMIDNGVVTLAFRTTEIKELSLNIKLVEKEIFIILFQLINKTNQLGFPRMIEQVESAQKHGFKKISLLAYGSYVLQPEWDGYIVWGKYGFLMTEVDQINLFNTTMKEDRLTHCTDISILLMTKEGTALWKHIGNSWYGGFELDKTSDSVRIFTAYRNKRKL